MMKGAKSVREVEAMKLRGQEKAKEEEMSVVQEENTEDSGEVEAYERPL